jgi:hypothetical protein
MTFPTAKSEIGIGHAAVSLEPDGADPGAENRELATWKDGVSACNSRAVILW